MRHELRPVVGTVDLAVILGNGSERDNVIEIESCGVNVLNTRLHILFGTLVKGTTVRAEPRQPKRWKIPGSIQVWQGCSKR
jgi:hypothetical protein